MVAVALPDLRSGHKILTPEGERAVDKVKQVGHLHPAEAIKKVAQATPMVKNAAPVANDPTPVPKNTTPPKGRPTPKNRPGGSPVKPVAKRKPVRVATIRASAKPKPVARAKPVRPGGPVRYRPAPGRAWQRVVVLRMRISRGWAPVSAALHEAMDRLESRDENSHPAARHQSDGAPRQLPPDPGITSVLGEPAEAVGSPAEVVPAKPEQAPKQARFDVEAVTYRPVVGRPRSVPVDSGPIPEIGDERPAAGEPSASTEAAAEPDVDPTIDLREPDEQPSGGVRHAR